MKQVTKRNIKVTIKMGQRMTEPSESGWRAQIITLFPEAFPGVLGHSLIGKALTEGVWSLDLINLRDFGRGRHRQVDDTPAGGGAGLVIRADVLADALDHAARMRAHAQWPVVYLSPRGTPFTQKMARSWAQTTKGITLICGRFEGIDERVIEAYGIEEVSLGDFILTGGEIAAQALIDATIRLIPRVLGNAESIEAESFSQNLLEYPQYTRPSDWNGRVIPEILLSGHHSRIAEWRHDQSQRLTQQRRPDLWRAYLADNQDHANKDSDGDQEL